MSRQIFIGLISEGTTDNRFLESIVTRTFDDIGFECNGEVETEVKVISIDKTGKGFTDQVIEASKKGVTDYGIMVLCVHTDSDNVHDTIMFNNKINPAQEALNTKDENFCKILTPIVPIQMIEAWMLADKELLKSEIGTNKSDLELGINRKPESIANPKNVIEDAIRIARSEFTSRRRKDLKISELYLPIGQKMQLEYLDSLGSYKKFKESIRIAYRNLNFMQ